MKLPCTKKQKTPFFRQTSSSSASPGKTTPSRDLAASRLVKILHKTQKPPTPIEMNSQKRPPNKKSNPPRENTGKASIIFSRLLLINGGCSYLVDNRLMQWGKTFIVLQADVEALWVLQDCHEVRPFSRQGQVVECPPAILVLEVWVGASPQDFC